MALTNVVNNWRGPRSDMTRYRQGATRLGITLDAYVTQIKAGNKWCSGCRHWQPRSEFGPHRWRPGGLNTVCLEVGRYISREAMRRRRERRRSG